MNYLIMSIIMVIVFYFLFLRSGDKEKWEELGVLSSIVRYLSFGAIVSFFGGRIFEAEWLYLITLYSVIGLFVCECQLNNTKKVVITVGILFFVAIYRVPTEDSFKEYISSKDTFECIDDYECVKIASKKKPDGGLETVVKVLRIKERAFEWKLFYAKGHLTLENDKGEAEELKGINIAGFWFDY